MSGVTLKGLLGRKVRTALTAVAIVLGVAMVSGTYVFTDSVSKAFDTIFTTRTTGSDAVDHGKEDVRREPRRSGRRHRRPGELLARVQRASRRRGGVRRLSSTSSERNLIDKQGEPISTPDSALRPRHRRERAALQPAPAYPKAAGRPGRTRSRSTSVTAGKERASRPARRSSRRQSRDCAPVHRSPGSPTSRSLDSIGALTLAIFDMPTAQAFLRQVGSGSTRSTWRRRTASPPDALGAGEIAAARAR